MKQRLLLGACLCFSLGLSAQTTISHATNSPRSGDVLVKQQIEYFSDGEEGSDAVWDFSDLRTTGEMFVQEYLCDSDSVLIGTDPEMMYRYGKGKDSLNLVSVESPLKIIRYETPQTLITYPFLYGSNICNPFYGIGAYCKQQTIRHKGTLLVEANAQGSIIEAGGDTLRNALRVHSLRISSLSMHSPSDTLYSDSSYQKQEIEEKDQWYVRGYRYPIYETVSTTYYDDMTQVSCIQNAYHYLPEDQVALGDPVNEDILMEDSIAQAAAMDIIHYTVEYDGNTLTLNYDLDADATISTVICNKMGMLFQRRSERIAAGQDYQMQFNCSGLRPDDYILYINVNGKVYSEKFKVK